MKLQEANLHEQACEYFFQSLEKKSEYIEAQIALKSSAQRVVNNYLDDFFKSKNFQETKDAVYHYRSAKIYQEKVNGFNVKVDIPQHYTKDYEVLLNHYVETIYNKALAILEKESFNEAEQLFKEVSLLLPNYKDVQDLQDVATYEPKYRQALFFLENEKFRASYYQFNKIPKSYKDTEELQAMALEAGLFTVGLLKFENATNKKGGEASISAYFSDNIIKLNNPFLKLVDRTHTETIINEQLMGLSGQTTENTAANAGELIGVKAILTGKLVSYTKEKKPLRKEEIKAWFERRVKKYNKETEKHYYEIEYDKINYQEFYASNNVSIAFQYQLISTESGEILLSDIIRFDNSDEIHYASANYNYRNITPGTWKWKNKSHPSDEVYKSVLKKNALKQLFKNKRELKSIEQLADELYQKSAQQVAQKIHTYNPEN